MHSPFPTLGPIVIGVNDLDQAKRFYTKLFGIKINEEDDHYLSATMIDGTHIELEEDCADRFPNWAKHNIGTFKNSQFVVSDIVAFLSQVVQLGGTVVSEPTQRPWGDMGAEFFWS